MISNRFAGSFVRSWQRDATCRLLARCQTDWKHCSSPIRCARHEKDFFLLGASSSVWDCRLIRRPAKDARLTDTELALRLLDNFRDYAASPKGHSVAVKVVIAVL